MGVHYYGTGVWYVYIEYSILTWKIENAIVVSALSLVSSPTLKMSMPQLLDCSTIWNVEEISFYYLFLHVLLSPKRPPTNSRKSTYSEMSEFIIIDTSDWHDDDACYWWLLSQYDLM